MKRTWNLASVLQIVQKIPENYCPCLYLSIGQVWWLYELWFKRYIQKMHPVLCFKTHHDIIDLVNQGMVKNIKTWISWKWNITVTAKTANHPKPSETIWNHPPKSIRSHRAHLQPAQNYRNWSKTYMFFPPC